MDWHRQFGLVLIDYFTGTPFEVELEKDLSIKQQYLDVVIVRKGKGRLREPLPDGLEDLADHNLITFKSHHESLDDWALMELTGHYVNYRKQISPSPQRLLPASAFRLYAVCSRFPHNLANETTLERLNEGVYDCRRGSNCIRVIVAGQLAQRANNAPLHLFSDQPEVLRFGREHYRLRSLETSSILQQLFQGSEREVVEMPYTMADFRRDFAKEHFKEMTVLEQLAYLSRGTVEVRQAILSDMTPSDRRKLRKAALPVLLATDQRELLKLLFPETANYLPSEDMLDRVPLKKIEEFVKRKKKKSRAEK